MMTTLAIAAEPVSVFEMPPNSMYRMVGDQVLVAPARQKVEQKNEVQAAVLEKKQQKIVLSGIFKVAGEYVALIDGEPYRESAKLGEYRIIEIDMNSATLSKNGDKVRIYVENN
jgi:hypothetical protein